MPYCSKCRSYIPDGVNQCPVCGNVNKHKAQCQTQPSSGSGNTAHKQRSFLRFLKKIFSVADYTGDFSDAERKENTVISLLAYLGPLFLITLFRIKKSKYVLFHFLQGFMNFVVFIIICLLQLVLVPIINNTGAFGIIFFVLGNILYLAPISFEVCGIINAARKKAYTLPWWGRINFMKFFH